MSIRAKPALAGDLDKFFALSVDLLCIADVEGVFVRVSDSFGKAMGCPPQELLHRPYLDFVHPDDREATVREMQALREGRPVTRHVNRYRRADGGWLTLSWTAAPVPDTGLVYAVARDITTERLAQELAAAENARLLRYERALTRLREENVETLDQFCRLAVEESARAIGVERVSIWFFNEAKDAIECADLFTLSTGGHSRGAAIAKDACPRYFEAVQNLEAIIAHDALTNPQTSELARDYLLPAGIRSMLDVPVRSGGDLSGILCFEHVGDERTWDAEEARFATHAAGCVMLALETEKRRRHEADILHLNATLEQRVAERTQQLAESEQQFRSAMENSAIGMALVAPDGRWLRVNRALCEIVGYTPEELAGTDFQTITHPGDLEIDLDNVRRLLAGEIETYQMEKRYLHKTGFLVWALLSVSLVRDEAGAPRYFISQIQDITDSKNAEIALRRALEHEKQLVNEAQAGERAKSEFLAVMSHEVRTPMNGILGFADLLVRIPGLPPEARDYAETIARSGASLLRILDDILDLSRLEAGRLQIEMAPFSLRELLRDIVMLLNAPAKARGIAVAFEIEEGIGEWFDGDAGRLRQVLLNLAGNSLKFTDHGGVMLTARASPERGAGWIEFVVRDTGCGIPGELIEQIFEPFVQVDSSTSRQHGGAGLGLAISRRLVLLMGGAVTVSSREGEGTEFVAAIPLRRAAGEERTAEPGSPDDDETLGARHPLRILIAEDDHVNRKLLVATLRKLGYEPIAAQDGAQAVSIFQAERPDCVLMDIQMPGMDGIEATERIRRWETDKGGRRSYVVALTANTSPRDRERCLAAGMNAYLNKPVKREQLAATLLHAATTGAFPG